MRAGRLDREIIIERAGPPTDDGTGNEVPGEWETVAVLRAQLIESSTEEFVRSYGIVDEQLTIFRVRFVDGIDPFDRVSYEGKIHNIKEIKEIGRRRGLEIRTVEDR